MKYANTAIEYGRETVKVVLPLEEVPLFDPANPPQKNTYGVPDEVEVGWIKDGDNWLPPPPPTLGEIQAQYVVKVQKRLDLFAQTRGYDGILSACTYAASTVPQFRLEGQYAVEARDATWAKCYEIMALVMSGQTPLPSLDDLYAMLPGLEWPENAVAGQ